MSRIKATDLIIGFVLGLAAGFGIPIAQAFGAREEKRMLQTIMNAFYLCIFFSIVLTVLTHFTTETLLQSHGREMDEYRSEVHSYEDKSNAIARDLPSYLFTPSNHLVVYYPNGLEGPVYEWDKGQ